MSSKYVAIEMDLAQRIADGELGPGDRLPAERELATTNGVSRMTVRQALGSLEDRGLIERGVGRGTFVADPRVAHDLSRITGFSEQLRRQGLEPGARLRSARLVKAPPAAVAQALGLTRGAGAMRVRRLRLGSGVPLVLEDSWLPAELFAGLEGHDLTGSLYALMREEYGLEPVRGSEALEPAVADAATARALRIEPGSPLMLVERLAYAAGDRPVEFARDLFRGDRARFVVEVSGRVLAGA